MEQTGSQSRVASKQEGRQVGQMTVASSSSIAAVSRIGSWIPATGIRLSAVLALTAVALADAGGVGSPGPGDFDASGTVDMADQQLFFEAFGSGNPLYDLTADGRVDLEDLFALAELTRPAPGDFDGSGTVDLADQQLFFEAFGGVDPLYDLTADGRVDLEDLYALAELTRIPPAPGDFDGSGTVDLADQRLFFEAFGGADALYDLTVDGRVGLEDFHVLAELTSLGGRQLEGAEGPAGADEPTEPRYAVRLTGEAVYVTLPDYTIEVSHGSPFGITSFRLTGQPVDFVEAQLPLADWEWFWFGAPGPGRANRSIKLLQEEWGIPQIEQREDLVVLTYRRGDVLRPGIAVEVVFRLSALGSLFDVTYTIDNQSNRTLRAPYVMVGFPGFANHRWVSEVATAMEQRQTSYTSFLIEARELNKQEYLLLRHDVTPAPGKRESLRGGVTITAGRRTFTLSSSFLSVGDEVAAYSAHTNKDRYLTSHLYVTAGDIPSGGRRSLTVDYVATARVID